MLELKGEFEMRGERKKRDESRRGALASVLTTATTAVLLASACSLAGAPPGPDRVDPSETGRVLRVGTSGDYPPFSDASSAQARHSTARGGWLRWPFSRAKAGVGNAREHDWAGPDGPASEWPDLRGFDIDLARTFARHQGLGIEWVPFRWPELIADLEAGRFDLAMSGVTVRPERSRAGRYSLPVVESGAVLLVGRAATAATIGALDRPGVRIGVNGGGHLERVARARFRRATIIAGATNDSVIEALRASSARPPRVEARSGVDAVVTDTLEAPLWQARVAGSRVLGPFTTDRKAPLVRADAPELARALDAWLLERERDGSLRALRARHLGIENSMQQTALPLPALLATLDERLALIPAVAEAKRRSGAAVEDRKREARVIEAGLAAVTAECDALFESRTRSDPESDLQFDLGDEAHEKARRLRCLRLQPGVRALLEASIEAAKAIQRRVLASAPPVDADRGKPEPTLQEIRPALLRIGERLAWLAVRLQETPTRQQHSDRSVESYDSAPTPARSTEPLRRAVGDSLRRHQLDADTIDAFSAAIVSILDASAS